MREPDLLLVSRYVLAPQAADGQDLARLDQQLDDQVRKLLADPHHLRMEKSERGVVLHVNKILDWFADDFEQWGGGRVAFLRKYLAPERQVFLDPKAKVVLEFNEYSWDLNDASR